MMEVYRFIGFFVDKYFKGIKFLIKEVCFVLLGFFWLLNRKFDEWICLMYFWDYWGKF